MTSDTARLDGIRFAPPPVSHFSRPPQRIDLRVGIGDSGLTGEASAGGKTLGLPLFWYDPPWHLASPERCRLVADFVGACGVMIGGVARDITTAAEGLDDVTWPRLVAHRCDRAGWTLEDAQAATAIELRLGISRTATGGLEYSREQFSRWASRWGRQEEGRPTEAEEGEPEKPLPLPLVFPPEWADLSQMRTKVAQLRALSDAAVLVSCDEASLDEVLPAAVQAGADGLIVRIAADPVEALLRYRSILATLDGSARPAIWLAGGEWDAEQAVKCFALGATAISLDAVCNRWLLGIDDPEFSPAQQAAIKLGGRIGKTREELLGDQIRERLDSLGDAIAGIMRSLMVGELSQLGPQHVLVADGSSADQRGVAGLPESR